MTKQRLIQIVKSLAFIIDRRLPHDGVDHRILSVIETELIDADRDFLGPREEEQF